MTKIRYFLPVPSAPRVVIIGFPGVQTLDLTGPAEVFAAASRSAGRAAYRIVFASVGGGEHRTSCGLIVRTSDLRRIRPGRRDTVVVAGGDADATRRAATDRALLGWLRRAAPIALRTASVCSGAFVLAAAGLLDGKRAATHWEACDELARRFPAVTVDPNAIFVRDGAVWTSAGVTTGIDMALAIVEDDLGRALADEVAARLVLYIRRPGFQSQFSAALVAQTAGDAASPLPGAARDHAGPADRQAAGRARPRPARDRRPAGQDARRAVRVRQPDADEARVRARARDRPARVPRAARRAVSVTASITASGRAPTAGASSAAGRTRRSS
jgi:putative intracellular protease/amidase